LLQQVEKGGEKVGVQINVSTEKNGSREHFAKQNRKASGMFWVGGSGGGGQWKDGKKKKKREGNIRNR